MIGRLLLRVAERLARRSRIAGLRNVHATIVFVNDQGERWFLSGDTLWPMVPHPDPVFPSGRKQDGAGA